MVNGIVNEANREIGTLLSTAEACVGLLAGIVAAVGFFLLGWGITVIILAITGFFVAREKLEEILDWKIQPIITDMLSRLAQESKLAGSPPSSESGPIPAIIKELDENKREIERTRQEFREELKRRKRWFLVYLLFILLAAALSHTRSWYINYNYRQEIRRVQSEHDVAIKELQHRLRNPKLSEILVTGVKSVNDFAFRISTIDISKCPPEFQLEFMELIHKWQVMNNVMQDNTGMVAVIRNVLDFTRALDFTSQGDLAFSDVQMQYLRLNAIAKVYGTAFTQIPAS